MEDWGLEEVQRNVLTYARYVNKEKSKLPDAAKPGETDRYRTKDAYYWYIDYREFANVTKYRLFMMRQGIEEKLKQAS